MTPIESIDLHGLTRTAAIEKLTEKLLNALEYRESIVRIIHGQGKHSENFPVIKSAVRHWLEDSEFAKEHIRSIYRGEDGSPYTRPNAGETIIELKVSATLVQSSAISWEEEERSEAERRSRRPKGKSRRNTWR